MCSKVFVYTVTLELLWTAVCELPYCEKWQTLRGSLIISLNIIQILNPCHALCQVKKACVISLLLSPREANKKRKGKKKAKVNYEK